MLISCQKQESNLSDFLVRKMSYYFLSLNSKYSSFTRAIQSGTKDTKQSPPTFIFPNCRSKQYAMTLTEFQHPFRYTSWLTVQENWFKPLPDYVPNIWIPWIILSIYHTIFRLPIIEIAKIRGNVRNNKTPQQLCWAIQAYTAWILNYTEGETV